jgi:integrase
LLEVSASHPRDHVIFSLALGTGLRLAEIVGLNVGDVFTFIGVPRGRIRLRKEIAKGGRAATCSCPTRWGRSESTAMNGRIQDYRGTLNRRPIP